MKRALLSAAMVALLAVPAGAQVQVQVCQGTDNCTEVSPYGHRQLSVEAARNVARTNAQK
jgi:hypothetical protein